MSFEKFEYKRGILGQGCFVTGYATRPGLLRCRLPALLAMSLMDLGRWQMITVTENFYFDAGMRPESWRLEQLQQRIANERTRLGTSGLATTGLLPLNNLTDFYWRVDAEAIENAIVRLQGYPGDDLKKRFARILQQLPEYPGRNQNNENLEKS